MRKMMMLMAACMLSIASVAQTTESLSIADFEIEAGETKSVPVELTSETEYVGFQFDLLLPDGLTIALTNRGELDVELDKDMVYNHTLTAQKVSDTENLYRFLCFSMTNASFYETSGTIVHLTIQADADVPAGVVNGTLTDIRFAELSAIEHIFDEATFTITCRNALSEKEDITIRVGEDGLATYCPSYGVDFSNATQVAAYKASVNGSTLTLTKVETVAAGEGVLLRSLNGGSAEETLPTTKAAKNDDNAFVGVSEAVVLNETSGDYTNFVLTKKDNAVGFFKANNTRVAAGKAYLPVKDFAATSTRGFSIVFDDEVTGINEFTPDQPTGDDAIYTLGGARVVNPAKGIYIKNGRKVVVK